MQQFYYLESNTLIINHLTLENVLDQSYQTSTNIDASL